MAMTFKYGGITFPLTTSRDNSFLQDADPALFVMLDFLRYAITTYAGDRLVAESMAADCRAPISSAVEMALPYEAGPFVLLEQIKLPALFLARKNGQNDYHTITRSHETTTFEGAYVLPAMSAAQAERVLPMRWAVKAILNDRIERGQ